MEKTRSCFFIGHRDAKDSLLPALIVEVERHILEYDVTEFVVGRYGRFDGLAAQAVKQAKERRGLIQVTMLPREQMIDNDNNLPQFEAN